MKTALKKKSLEESLSGHTAQGIESESGVEVVGENKFKSLLNQYGEFLDKADGANLNYWYVNRIEKYNSSLLRTQELLNPKEINRFLQMTAIYEDHPGYTKNTGFFISRLMLLGLHDSKQQEFNFDVQNLKPISGLPMLLRSIDANKSLKVNIYGNIGNCVGNNSQHTVFDIHGDCGYDTGNDSKHCQYIFRGKIGSHVGIGSKDCTFTFLGQKKGEVHIPESTVGATYKFDNRDLANVTFSRIDSSSKVVYIHPNGSEEVFEEW